MLETVFLFLLDTLVVKIEAQPVLLQRQSLTTINLTLNTLISFRELYLKSSLTLPHAPNGMLKT